MFVTFLQQAKQPKERYISLFSFLFFILFPLHSQSRSIVTRTFASCGVSLLSHCNQRIHFPKHYASRSAGRRHLITDHYPGESRVSRDPLCARDARACSTQGEGRVENRKKRKKWGGEKSKKRRRRREEKRREENGVRDTHDTVTSGKTERLDVTVVVARGEPLTASTNSTPFPALPPSLRRHLRRSPLHTLFALSSTTPGANATTIPVPPCCCPPPLVSSLSFFPYLHSFSLFHNAFRVISFFASLFTEFCATIIRSL